MKQLSYNCIQFESYSVLNVSFNMLHYITPVKNCVAAKEEIVFLVFN